MHWSGCCPFWAPHWGDDERSQNDSGRHRCRRRASCRGPMVLGVLDQGAGQLDTVIAALQRIGRINAWAAFCASAR
jgi:hypothetical protein